MYMLQVQGWCQTMCLNRARQRRRHRRATEDWANLLQHALNADLSQDFQDWLYNDSSRWTWPEPEKFKDCDEHEFLVRNCGLTTIMAL